MLRIPVSWGKLTSRYDCLLAANLHAKIPEDRWIMFTRCRAWLVFQDYSQALNTDCLEGFALSDDAGAYWHYHIPSGQGEDVLMTLGLKMIAAKNAVQLTFYRRPTGGPPDGWKITSRFSSFYVRTSKTAIFIKPPKPIWDRKTGGLIRLPLAKAKFNLPRTPAITCGYKYRTENLSGNPNGSIWFTETLMPVAAWIRIPTYSAPDTSRFF